LKKSSENISDISKQIADQGFASWISEINHERRIPLFEALDKLNQELSGQDEAFVKALRELDWVRNKVGTPENILGSEKTKHGEIAEIAEVGIRRAKNIIQGYFPDAFWNESDRFGPDDYGIGGIPVQSKFINGINNGLKHVLDHAKKYPDFGTSDEGFYHIPKDQYEKIIEINNGNYQGLNERSISAIKNKIVELEELKGRSFEDLIRPASHNYSDVQQAKIHSTLDKHEATLDGENETLKKKIKEKNKDSIDSAQQKAAPTLNEFGKVTATGAVVGASLQITISVYKKWKAEGKNPSQFTVDDWKEIGGKTLDGATTGGISAASLYSLTNYSALSAPFAAAIVSSGRAMLNLTSQYKSGTITLGEYADLSIITCTEAGIVAAGAAIGQTLIPVPILGAVIGSSIARISTDYSKQLFGEKSQQIVKEIEAKFQYQISQLSKEHQKLLAKIEAKMLYRTELTTVAFDLSINSELLLLNSVVLSEEYNISGKKIIRTTSDVDKFILGN
jgi:hypothetical protein